jgi:hypothetical protein
MKIASTISKSKTPLLNAEQTKTFVSEITDACHKLDSVLLMKVIHKYKLQYHEDIERFVKDTHKILDFWKINTNKVEIKEVTTYGSKCIACSFGKNVKVFGIVYIQYLNGSSGPRLVYNKEFAINLDIQQDLLMDYGWCNAFLDKEDLKRLTSQKL